METVQPNTNVYAHNVPLHWDKDEVEKMFGNYGTIVSSRILKNPQSMVSRGVCFVRFSTAEEASACIAALNASIPQGGSAPMTVKIAKDEPKGPTSFGGGASVYGAASPASHSSRYSPYSRGGGSESEPQNNLYVVNLPKTYNEEDIKREFAPYGNVISSYILKDRDTMQSRGIGFCRLSSDAEAVNAMKNMHGKMLPGADNPLNITVAKDSRKDRAAQPATTSYGYGAAAPYQYPTYPGYQFPAASPYNPFPPAFDASAAYYAPAGQSASYAQQTSSAYPYPYGSGSLESHK